MRSHPRKPLRAILIAPDHATRGVYCTSVAVIASSDEPDCYDARHAQLLLDCMTVRQVDLAGQYAGHVLICDENALLKPHPGYIYHPPLHPAPLGGKLLVLSYDEEADARGVVRLEQAALTFDLANAYCLPTRARELARRRDADLRRQLPHAIFACSADLMEAAHGAM